MHRASSAAGSAAWRSGPRRTSSRCACSAAGQRPVSNVVDVSNYVMLELGKPIHTFDARGRRTTAAIVVRLARAGERLETLDHVERDADAGHAAHRRPERAARDRRRHGRRRVRDRRTRRPTSSSNRRSSTRSASAGRRSATPSAPRRASASRRARSIDSRSSARTGRPGSISEWAGGQVAAGAVDTNPTEPAPARVAFRPARVDRLLGTARSAQEQRRHRSAASASTTEPAPADARCARRGGAAAARCRSGRRRDARRHDPDLAPRPR